MKLAVISVGAVEAGIASLLRLSSCYSILTFQPGILRSCNKAIAFLPDSNSEPWSTRCHRLAQSKLYLRITRRSVWRMDLIWSASQLKYPFIPPYRWGRSLLTSGWSVGILWRERPLLFRCQASFAALGLFAVAGWNNLLWGFVSLRAGFLCAVTLYSSGVSPFISPWASRSGLQRESGRDSDADNLSASSSSWI